ncbi:hypothetical protein ADUPG1_008155 [Aduncisulcus paluster]|uniref:C3H1-type domain-containing protein n=1 Tax=Aduncisulcus paluster TaxID=2918883 RepID=A0ABQ5KQZ3_9EUKA|nr:hypothetical protein ADUPG1_008155 [Aduncisulcus paluster]
MSKESSKELSKTQSTSPPSKHHSTPNLLKPPRKSLTSGRMGESDNVCREFLRGQCHRGRQCHFHHPSPAEMIVFSEFYKPIILSLGLYSVCKDHLNRKCSRDNCKYLHPAPFILDFCDTRTLAQAVHEDSKRVRMECGLFYSGGSKTKVKPCRPTAGSSQRIIPSKSSSSTSTQAQDDPDLPRIYTSPSSSPSQDRTDFQK